VKEKDMDIKKMAAVRIEPLYKKKGQRLNPAL
jgi:hypothetical protein